MDLPQRSEFGVVVASFYGRINLSLGVTDASFLVIIFLVSQLHFFKIINYDLVVGFLKAENLV